MKGHYINRVRLIAALLAVCAAASLISCAGILDAIEDRMPPPQEAEGGYRFLYQAPAARWVTLAGNFNNWGGTQGGGRYDPTIDPMTDEDGDGVWSVVVPLPPGRYRYKFVVDNGVRWEMDPSNPDSEFEGGIENSLLIVPPTIRYRADVVTGTVLAGARTAATSEVEIAKAAEVVFELDAPEAGGVYVAGEFNEWDEGEHALEKDENGVWRLTLEIPPGKYEYKFVVDGVWVEDPENPDSVSDPFGGKNSVLTVE